MALTRLLGRERAAELSRLAVDAETPGPGAETTTPAVLAPETTAAPPPLQAAARELTGALDRFDKVKSGCTRCCLLRP